MAYATVVEYHREYCWLRLVSGEEVVAKPRSRLEIEQQREEKDWEKEGRQVFANQIAVGDEVVASQAESGEYVIEGIQGRQTWLARKTTRKYKRRLQLVVANADKLAVVVAPNPEIKLNIVDRYFIAAIQGGVDPFLVVNKIDLDETLPGSVEIHDYRKLGYRVYFTSALDGKGLDMLGNELSSCFTAFCGHSGVGKSTLLSKLTGIEIKTGMVMKGTYKGRQTTTTSRMYSLKGGGEVVDTPGIKEFGLSHLTWLDVHDYFSDIGSLTQMCSFRDCLHQSEPGCAVQEAVGNGELSKRRLESYVKLRNECEEKPWD